MPQGHFNIINPGLQIDQIQLALPVEGTQTGIVRGMTLVADNGSFRKADRTTNADEGDATTPGKVIWWGLQDQDSPDVLKSGKVSALPCTWPMHIETDQYDSGGTFTPGGYVSIDDGAVVTDHATTETAIGIVTAAPYNRWVNDRLNNAGGTERRGQFVSVIRFLSVYLPSLVTA